MEAWIHQVGLAEDTGTLRKEIDELEAVDNVKGRAAESRPLGPIVQSHLKSLLYDDADDIVDELNYFRLLQHQVEERGTIARDIRVESEADEPRNTTGIYPKDGQRHGVSSSADGKPLKAQCNHCGAVLGSVGCDTSKGASVLLLHNHLKSGNCKRSHAANEQRPHPLRLLTARRSSCN